jgi:uncharacterized membrane protein YoaT (DUF817 family)
MLRTLDAHFLETPPHRELSGLRRGVLELCYFVAKEARACLFVALFFLAVFTVPRAGLFGLPRYDALLAIMTFTIVANLKHIKARVHVPTP